MRFHDYHLSTYEVSDGGETITFLLVYGCPGEETDSSRIRFSDVALYNFLHTNNAIILDIEELPIAELIRRGDLENLAEWHHWHGVRLWDESYESYIALLQSEGYKAWIIESSIGFYGFVIARSVEGD